MYKYLIIGIACMFVASGGYYINKSGGIGLLFGALTSDETGSLVRLNANDISGLYICGVKSGCTSKYILLLRDDMSSKIVVLEEDITTDEFNETESVDTQANELIEISSSTEEGSSTSTNIQLENIANQNQEEVAENTVENDARQILDENIDLESIFSEETNGEETPSNVYKGTWDVEVQNMLVITLLSQGTTTYDVPQKIVVKSVSANSLSRISFTRAYYPDMITPVFIRQE